MTLCLQENASAGRKFVLEFIDQLTDCISSESVIETNDIAAVCEIVDPEASDIHPAAVYDLALEDIDKLMQRFGIVSDDTSPVARFRSWRPMDELPYMVHTNRELALMLAGDKPLAAFSESYPSTMDYEFIPESRFDPYVTDGLFFKREYILPEKTNRRKTRVVLYARKGEEWRVEAYILLKQTADKSGWGEGFERMEGSLLGYEEWQNDIYIATMFNGRAKQPQGAGSVPAIRQF
jgi:hypothetical protein